MIARSRATANGSQPYIQVFRHFRHFRLQRTTHRSGTVPIVKLVSARAQDYRAGQELVKNRNFKRNAAFFQDVFEIGRRYKIMNPDRMRGTYGKLLYMLMDSSSPHVEELLEFSCIKCAFCAYSMSLDHSCG